jgi:SAM-dependent methyltransferase
LTGSRWTDRDDVPRGAEYDERFERLAASGTDVHGEADLVAALAPGGRILDAGCGTGRVAIELASRGHHVVGLDLDPQMLAAARRKAPELAWVEGDLATTRLDERFDVVVLAGNVLIFVAPGTEAEVVARCAEHLVDDGLLVAGFQVAAGGFDPAALDAAAEAVGLHLVDRWSTWDRAPWAPTDGYQVSVHRRT